MDGILLLKIFLGIGLTTSGILRLTYPDIGESERAHVAVLLTDHVSFTLRGMRARHLREKSK
jgi:hypothetical protein